MKNTLLLSILLSGMVLSGCKKDPDGMDNVSVRIDGEYSEFRQFSATYLKQANCIVIRGRTIENEWIHLFAYLATPGPIGTSLFRPNGSNTAMFVEELGKKEMPEINLRNHDHFGYSDENRPELEGSLTITKLDEATKKVSGTFSFKSYNRHRNLTRTITEGTFTDMELGVDDTDPFTQGSMTSTVSPSATEYSSKFVRARQLMLFTVPTIEVEVMPIIFQDYMKKLVFTLPATPGTGTFDLRPRGTYDSYNYHTASYHFYDWTYEYDTTPNTGTITIHSLDLVNKTISFSFNMEMKNEEGKTITFTNGQLETKFD